MALSPRKQREREARMEDILAAAREVFFEKGFQAATMEEIAQKAGFSKGAVYFYFKSKEEILVHINCELMEVYRGFLEDLRRDAASGKDLMKGLLDNLRTLFRTHLASLDNLVYFSPGSQPLNVPPELDERWYRSLMSILDIFQSVIQEEAARAGQVEPGAARDPLQYALFALSMGLGVFQLSKVRNQTLKGLIDVDRQFDILEEVVTRGLLGK